MVSRMSIVHLNCSVQIIVGFLTSGTFDSSDPGADVNLDIVWDDQLLLREDVLHLEQWYEACAEQFSRSAHHGNLV